MKQVDINICIAGDGFFSAYCADFPALFGGGETRDEAIAELRETLEITKGFGKDQALFYPAWLDEEYEFVVHYEVQSFLEYYAGIITPAALGRLTGINPKQLWNYAHGVSKPRKAQVQKIESALHKLGSELQNLSFC
jgi:predicted RNase H-like HicB family nuclease